MARRWSLLLTLAASLAWLRDALTTPPPLDYRFDGAPAIDALARLDISAFLHSGALMGPVSIVLRAPFAAAAGGDGLLAYRLGTLPCLAAMAVLLFVLLRRAPSTVAGVALAVLFAVNPVIGSALTWGHPEEILGASLCVLAVLAAADGRTRAATVLLALALTTKQWALLAIAPVLLAAPARRGAILLGAGALAAALTAPFVLASTSAFAGATKAAASVQSWVAPPNVWWPLAQTTSHKAFDGVGLATVRQHALPSILNPVPHPLIVLAGIALGVALWRRVPRPSLRQALGLLALCFLLRDTLDPWNNVYYHVPFLLALLAFDLVPGAIGLGLVWVTFMRVWPATRDTPDVVFAFYILWTTGLTAWLAASVFAPARLQALAERANRGLRAGVEHEDRLVGAGAGERVQVRP